MDLVDQNRNRSGITLLRLGFVVLGFVAAILGFFGFARFLAGQDDTPAEQVDVLYYTLQLFVLDADQLTDGAGDLPWQLQVARFAAPAATVFALVETARLLLIGEVHRLRVRRARQHVVVCGDSAVARNLAAGLHATGRTVVVIGAPAGSHVTSPRRRLYHVPGDPTDTEVLRTAGAGRADLLYACTGSSTDNVLTATTAGLLCDEHNDAMRIYAQIHDPELCLAMQARRLSHSLGSSLRLDFFNVDELAARWLFRQDPLPATRLSRLLVVGLSPFGRAVLVELARHWRMQETRAAGRLQVDLVAVNGRTVIRELFHRYPFLAQVCDVAVYERDFATPSPDVMFDLPYDRVFICYEDEELGLKTALTTPSLWQGGPGSVIVPVTRLSGLAGAFTDGDDGTGLLDAVSGTVRCYPMVQAAGDADRIGDDLVERLGRSIHDRYVLAHRAHDSDPTGNPAMWPWAVLPEDLRRANRAQAQDIGRKLRTLGMALAPRQSANPPMRLSADQVDRLAVMEHDRWVAERWAAGWRPGRQRDRSLRTHPDLQRWEKLSDSVQEKNRQEVRQIPDVLADIGLEIVSVAGRREPAATSRPRGEPVR
ncbi:RyR domain-containing protein [Solwaraspora sp. WMMB335]|uniref:RyR domain-containing protein n=1 Tax=Solwaraspora sp. WMMB335 TaxID=3404118 RepID=UPI003B93F756